jgi:serine/threonine-protein kinase
MAEVYVAEAESVAGFKKKVAIKRILPELLKEERFVRMFLDEARLALHLNHANIVSVFDIGKSSSTYFIVMEYVEGTNLKHIIQYLSRKRTPMPIHLAVWVLNEILKGLDYAHNLRDPETGRTFGIVHRDISPPNILISWNGEVKLTDFGLAKASTQLESTDPGVVKGKFSYLSPEAANGREVDLRSDIFAVGIMAWEMLAGRRLFLAETDYQTVERVRQAEVPPVREFNPNVPAELERIVLKALARDLEDRHARASDFADELLGFLFSRSLKVSSRDLSELLAEMRRVEPEPVRGRPPTDKSNVVLKLIEEEFTGIKSLDEDSDAPVTGSTPLDQLMRGELLDDYDPSSPLPVGDFESKARRPHSGESTPPPPPHSSPMRLRGAGTPPAAKKKPIARAWLIVTALAVAGGGAYYWLVVMGNLGRFTG